MSAKAELHPVKASASFEASLNEARQFLTAEGHPQDFDALLDELLTKVVPFLGRFPQIGRPLLDEKAGAAEGAAADALPATAPAPAFGGEPASLGEPAYAAATSVRGSVALPAAFVPPHPAYEQE